MPAPDVLSDARHRLNTLDPEANRLDDDAPGPTLANSDLMRSVPDTMEPFIKVPKVLGEGEGA